MANGGNDTLTIIYQICENCTIPPAKVDDMLSITTKFRETSAKFTQISHLRAVTYGII